MGLSTGLFMYAILVVLHFADMLALNLVFATLEMANVKHAPLLIKSDINQ